jgi:hypothetical protein
MVCVVNEEIKATTVSTISVRMIKNNPIMYCGDFEYFDFKLLK